MENFIEYLKRSLKPQDLSEFCELNSFSHLHFANLKQDGIMILRNKPPEHLLFCEQIQLSDNYFLVKKCYRNLDWLNEDGSFTWNKTQEPLYRRLLPPPDESVNHPLLIFSIISSNNPSDKTYIEYGVRSGTTLLPISSIVKKSYGIDIQDTPVVPDNCSFYKCFTDEFSIKYLPTLNYHFAFIDADHKFESCIKDFDYIYKYIQSSGYIFLHDTYPCEERFLDMGACNDCYKTPIKIKEKYPDIEIVTLPLNPGLTIIRKK